MKKIGLILLSLCILLTACGKKNETVLEEQEYAQIQSHYLEKNLLQDKLRNQTLTMIQKKIDINRFAIQKQPSMNE